MSNAEGNSGFRGSGLMEFWGCLALCFSTLTYYLEYHVRDGLSFHPTHTFHRWITLLRRNLALHGEKFLKNYIGLYFFILCFCHFSFGCLPEPAVSCPLFCHTSRRAPPSPPLPFTHKHACTHTCELFTICAFCRPPHGQVWNPCVLKHPSTKGAL